ncbi:MAG: glycosyltransferase family 4 protein [Thermoplasmata archaeon]|nr:glycosyltransferase family 4 protein [Thermoplasmata archaeon]
MKILWNNHRDVRNPRSGGAERTIREVGSRLVSRGHEVHLVTVQWRGAPRVATEDGIRVHRFPGNFGPHLTSALVARRVGADVTVDDLGHVVPWFSPQLRRGRGVAFFRHLHRRTLPGQVGEPLASLLSGVERLYPSLYRRWEFAVESASSRADLERLGARTGAITELPPGVDLTAFSPQPRSAEPSIVVFTGLRRYKRPDHAIRALALLRERGVRATLTVVGDGPLLPKLRALSAASGVGAAVMFPGRLSEGGLRAIVPRAWVNVNCAVAEGWGYSILEAAASGVPTAAYDVPGIREGIGGGAAGVLVPDGDIPALADALARLIETNASWRPRCRAYAERFPWDDAARRWETMLQRIAG